MLINQGIIVALTAMVSALGGGVKRLSEIVREPCTVCFYKKTAYNGIDCQEPVKTYLEKNPPVGSAKFTKSVV